MKKTFLKIHNGISAKMIFLFIRDLASWYYSLAACKLNYINCIHAHANTYYIFIHTYIGVYIERKKIENLDYTGFCLKSLVKKKSHYFNTQTNPGTLKINSKLSHINHTLTKNN